MATADPNATGPLTSQDPNTPDELTYIGGDPVMGAIAVGHDYQETVAAEQQVQAAAEQKGSPLSSDEEAAILAQHPGADSGLAGQPIARAAHEVGQGVLGALGSLASFGKWLVIGVAGVAVILIIMEVRSARGAVKGAIHG
jgi:hypothetical protein